MRLVLASASERRLQLLAQLGIVAVEVCPSSIDESPHKGELPKNYCIRMALEKASAIQLEFGDLVLAADTTVAVGRRILGKPQDPKEAEMYLRLLSGRRHRVITAVVVRTGLEFKKRVVEVVVKVKRLSETELQGYIRSCEWRGKAGGYAIQGRAAAFIPWIRGSYSAVVGLPLAETASLLRSVGLKIEGDP